MNLHGSIDCACFRGVVFLISDNLTSRLINNLVFGVLGCGKNTVRPLWVCVDCGSRLIINYVQLNIFQCIQYLKKKLRKKTPAKPSRRL